MRHTRIIVTHYGGPEVRVRRWQPYLAFPRGSRSRRNGSGLRSYFLATWGTIGFRTLRSSLSHSWNRDIRRVHRWRLASPGPETGRSLQHPVAQEAEAGNVSTGFDRPV